MVRLNPPLATALAALCCALLAYSPLCAEPQPVRGGPVKPPPVSPGGRQGTWEIQESDQWPWTAVGRLNVVFDLKRKGNCTGALVGPRLVLTAPHCLVNPQTGEVVQPGQAFFQVGYSRGRDLGHSQVEGIIASPGFAYTQRPNGPNAASQDWALLILRDRQAERPLPMRTLPYPEMARLAASGQILQVGYGMERQHVLSVARKCKALGDPDLRVIRHACLSNFGYSGAPLIAQLADGPVVIGVGSLADPGRSGVAAPAERFEAEASRALGRTQ
jgi:V8-like Glu-specific endopeptidase